MRKRGRNVEQNPAASNANRPVVEGFGRDQFYVILRPSSIRTIQWRRVMRMKIIPEFSREEDVDIVTITPEPERKQFPIRL